MSIQIDTTAMLQGVYNARADHSISESFAERIINVIRNISYPGPVERSVCDYDTFLKILADVQPHYCVELSMLWQHLGDSLASGITVANQELMTIDYCQNCETNPGIKREFQTIPGSGYSKTAIRYICDECYTKNECCGWCGDPIDVDDAYTVRISENEHYHDECWEKKTKVVLD